MNPKCHTCIIDLFLQRISIKTAALPGPLTSHKNSTSNSPFSPFASFSALSMDAFGTWQDQWEEFYQGLPGLTICDLASSSTLLKALFESGFVLFPFVLTANTIRFLKSWFFLAISASLAPFMCLIFDHLLCPFKEAVLNLKFLEGKVYGRRDLPCKDACTSVLANNARNFTERLATGRREAPPVHML